MPRRPRKATTPRTTPQPATTPAKSRRPGRPRGPYKYRAEFATLARKLAARLGATDADLADIFEVSRATISAWKLEHAEFAAALAEGKTHADAQVMQSLYRRALGYTHPAVKIVADAKTGATITVPYRKQYPPDTVACIFWLKNRQPELWRDKHELEAGESLGALLRQAFAPVPAAGDAR